MKVRVIKSFRDKDTKEAIRKGREIEISEERFGELTAGPLGAFVEEIRDVPLVDPTSGQNTNEVPKGYKCKKCDFETDNKGVLASHYKTVHTKPKE